MAVRIGVLVLALAATACSGSGAGPGSSVPGSPSPSPTPPVSSTPAASTTAVPSTTLVASTTSALPVGTGDLGILDAAVSPDGTLAVDAALTLVAAGYRPVPGVTPAAAPLLDGGPALRAALGGSDGLGLDQQAALAAITEPPGVALEDAAGAGARPRLAAAAGIVTAALRTFVQSQARPLPPEVRVTMLELPYDGGGGTHHFSSAQSHATALQLGDEDDPECRIRVNATSTLGTADAAADPAFVAALAHEAYHCLQQATAPAIDEVPLWVVEGAAAFAGDDIAGANELAAPWWRRWVGEPHRPLDRRTYDAVGFFSLLDESASAYPFADAMLVDWGADSIRRRLDPTGVFDAWGTHYATAPSWGPEYAFAALGAAGLVAPHGPVSLTVDGAATTIGGPATTELSAAPYRFAVPGDVLEVAASPANRGGMRFGDGQEVALRDASQSFCVAATGCACPGIAPEALSITEVASTDLFVGLGPSAGGGPVLAARSLARWCRELAVPPPPAGTIDQCLVGTWTSTAYIAPEASGVAQTVTGGTGAVVTFGPDGSVQIDMDATTPVGITTTDADGTTTTTVQYRGVGSGTWAAGGGVLDVMVADPTAFVAEMTTGAAAAGAPAALPGINHYECTPVSLTIGEPGGPAFELAP